MLLPGLRSDTQVSTPPPSVTKSSAPASAPAPTSGTRFNMDDVDAAFTQTGRGSHSREA